MPCRHRSRSTPTASFGDEPTMKRCAMWRTAAAAAAPSARRPAAEPAIRMATSSDGGRSSTSSRYSLRWRARSSSEWVAGVTSTSRNRAARSSASREASAIALSSRARSGLREGFGKAVEGQSPPGDPQGDCVQYRDLNPGTDTDSHGQVIGQGCLYPSRVLTLGQQIEALGYSWKGYMEDMGYDTNQDGAVYCGHPPIGG